MIDIVTALQNYFIYKQKEQNSTILLFLITLIYTVILLSYKKLKNRLLDIFISLLINNSNLNFNMNDNLIVEQAREPYSYSEQSTQSYRNTLKSRKEELQFELDFIQKQIVAFDQLSPEKQAIEECRRKVGDPGLKQRRDEYRHKVGDLGLSVYNIYCNS